MIEVTNILTVCKVSHKSFSKALIKKICLKAMDGHMEINPLWRTFGEKHSEKKHADDLQCHDPDEGCQMDSMRLLYTGFTEVWFVLDLQHDSWVFSYVSLHTLNMIMWYTQYVSYIKQNTCPLATTELHYSHNNVNLMKEIMFSNDLYTFL